MGLIRRLYPTEEEINALAKRETDPRLYTKFNAITRGPLFALLALACIGIAALFVTPIRLLLRRG